MKVLHKGYFLREGLLVNGHEVASLEAESDRSIQENVAATGFSPDFVLLEIFGNTVQPENLAECDQTLVAYIIDTPINEFWLSSYLKLFDYVFVDQQHCVESLGRKGISAEWLPLFTHEKDFRPPKTKKHFITFVGRVNEQRIKRNNILKHISKRFPINHVEGVSRWEMQDISAESHIILNENFFAGLNLRTFHAMASGALLLTENNSHGIEHFFNEEQDYSAYSPETLISNLTDIHSNLEQWQDRAQAAQKKCYENHRSLHRAAKIVESVSTGKNKNERETTAQRIFHENHANYLYCKRFGGNFTPQVKAIEEICRTPNAEPFSIYTLGSIYAEHGNTGEAAENFKNILEINSLESLLSALKMTLINLHSPELAEEYLNKALTIFKHRHPETNLNHPFKLKDEDQSRCLLYLLFAEMLIHENLGLQLGFRKQQKDRFPETAFEYAILAWEILPSSKALELILSITRNYGIASEALPYLKQSILNGLASDSQTLQAVELAQQYYDFELAQSIIKSFRKKISHTR